MAPGPAGGHAHAKLVGEHRITAGHEGRALFVAHNDGLDLRGLGQCKQHVGIRLTGAGEDRVNADALECLDYDFTDVHEVLRRLACRRGLDPRRQHFH